MSDLIYDDLSDSVKARLCDIGANGTKSVTENEEQIDVTAFKYVDVNVPNPYSTATEALTDLGDSTSAYVYNSANSAWISQTPSEITITENGTTYFNSNNYPEALTSVTVDVETQSYNNVFDALDDLGEEGAIYTLNYVSSGVGDHWVDYSANASSLAYTVKGKISNNLVYGDTVLENVSTDKILVTYESCDQTGYTIEECYGNNTFYLAGGCTAYVIDLLKDQYNAVYAEYVSHSVSVSCSTSCYHDYDESYTSCDLIDCGLTTRFRAESSANAYCGDSNESNSDNSSDSTTITISDILNDCGYGFTSYYIYYDGEEWCSANFNDTIYISGIAYKLTKVTE